MIKRFLTLLMAVAIVATSTLLVGCTKNPDNYSMANVSSNGGIGAIYNGYVYYIGGGTTELEDPTSQQTTSASIYKLAVDESGNPVSGAEPTVVYRGIAGFTKGELFIFGEYIYFAVPSSKISSSADRLVKRTTFVRIDLNGENYKELYTTETEDDLKYEYYSISDTELRLVVLEGTDLYSLSIGKKAKRTDIDSDVTSVAFTSTNGKGGGAEEFVYYTKAPKDTYLTQKGVMVYKVSPNGENKKQISSGEDISLLSVQYGYLYYKLGEVIYRTTTSAGLDKTNVVSYSSFKSYLFLENGGVIGVDEDNSKTVYVRWNAGNLVESKTIINDKNHTLMFVNGNTLFAYNNSKVIHRFDISADSVKSEKVANNIITTVGEELDFELIGKYIYTFTENTIKDDNGNDLKITELIKLDSTATVKAEN